MSDPDSSALTGSRFCAVFGSVSSPLSAARWRIFKDRLARVPAGLARAPFLGSHDILDAGSPSTLGNLAFQALFQPTVPIYDVYLHLEECLEMPLCLGVGYGNSRPVALHRSRVAFSALWMRKPGLAAYCGDSGTDAFVLTYVALLERLRRSWTDRQREVIRALQTAEYNQTQAANKLGVSHSAVNQCLRLAGWRLFEQGRHILNTYLVETYSRFQRNSSARAGTEVGEV